MAILKVSELTELAAAPADGDNIIINDVSEVIDANKTKRTTVANFFANLLTSIANTLTVSKRVGGSTSDWTTNGTTTYTPVNTLAQVGVTRVTITPNQSYVDVTLPTTYSKKPIVFTNVIYDDSSAYSYVHGAWGYALSTSSIRIYATTQGSTTVVLDVAWMTIGE